MIHETTVSPRRQRARERRTERIVAVAMRVVSEEGFDALTMARIAEELDLTAGSLYRYFPSKDALVVELQARALAQLRQRFEQGRAAWQPLLPTAETAARLAELLGIAELYVRLAADEPRLFRLLSLTVSDPRQLVDDQHALRIVGPFAALLEAVAERFEAAARSAALAPGNAAQRTILFWAGLQGVMQLGKLGRLDPRGQLDPAALIPELLRTLLAGWGAPAAALDEALGWYAAQRTNKEIAS